METATLRVILSSDTRPHFNIALEEALHIETERTLVPVVRFWRMDRAVIMGNSRTIAGDLYLENCELDSIPVIRRHSGGGTVYVHRDVLNCSIILPYCEPYLMPRSKVRESVLLLQKPVADALKMSGMPVDINSNGDLRLNGRKVGGIAQARKKRTILHHGTLMFDDRVDEMSKYLRVPPERMNISHREFVTSFVREGFHPDEEGLIGQMVQGWADFAGCGKIRYSAINVEEEDLACELMRKKYTRGEHNLKR